MQLILLGVYSVNIGWFDYRGVVEGVGKEYGRSRCKFPALLRLAEFPIHHVSAVSHSRLI